MKKKSMAKKKMPMTTVNGKKVPAFAADGKGANDIKKGYAAKLKSYRKVSATDKAKKVGSKVKDLVTMGPTRRAVKSVVGKIKSATKMKKAPMKVTAKQASKLPANLVKAIRAKEGSAAKMKKAAMKLKKDSMAMMKKSVMEMKKASAMKMKMKKAMAKMKKASMAKMGHKKK